MSVKFRGTTLKMDSRHSWPAEMFPRAHVIKHYFWGTSSESHVLGGRTFRTILIWGYIYDSSWATHDALSNYLDETVHPLIGGTGGDLEVSLGSSSKTFSDCYLAQVEPVPQPGQKFPIALPDVVGGTVGPAGGGYWLEVNLHFAQPNSQ